MDSNTRISDFHVRFIDGKTLSGSIDKLYLLNNYILRSGRECISSIIFYFHDVNNYDHCLTLRNNRRTRRFIVEFYHYYDQLNNRVDISNDQQKLDLNSVLSCLNNMNNLNDLIVDYILYPY
jgi:hypothetical protein